MAWPWVHEDLDLPGEGQPRSVRAYVQLVDSSTGRKVKEAYCDGKTIVGPMRAPIDGTPQQWHQAHARAEWRLRLAPNDLISRPGVGVGGTLWQREVHAWPHVGLGGWGVGKPTKSKVNFYVPDAGDVQIELPDLTELLDDTDERRVDESVFADEDFEVTLRWADPATGEAYPLLSSTVIITTWDGVLVATNVGAPLDDGWRRYRIESESLPAPGAYRYSVDVQRDDGFDQKLRYGTLVVRSTS